MRAVIRIYPNGTGDSLDDYLDEAQDLSLTRSMPVEFDYGGYTYTVEKK